MAANLTERQILPPEKSVALRDAYIGHLLKRRTTAEAELSTLVGSTDLPSVKRRKDLISLVELYAEEVGRLRASLLVASSAA